MSKLSVENLDVSYPGPRGAVVALDGYSLEVAPGSLMVLLGESGCGKTTALNAIAGLLEPDSGRITLGDKVIFERRKGSRGGIVVPPNRRDIGMVFQSYALWPHLSVLENVMYPAKRRGANHEDALSAATAALATVRCDAFAQRHPGELSGGQQQRVALARAMVARPKLILFDEPLSNLDASLRRGLRDELARLHREIGFTGVYVTHDQSEALALGTELAVMEGGKIIQSGPPATIYERPANEFVARFFGANAIAGRVTQPGRVETGAGVFEGGGGATGRVSVAFMPHVVTVEAAADGPLTVTAAMYVGSHWELRLSGPECEVLAYQPATRPAPEVGAKARIRIAPGQIHTYGAGGTAESPRTISNHVAAEDLVARS